MKRSLLFLLALTCLSTGCAAGRVATLRQAFDDDLDEARKQIRAGNRRQAIDDLSMMLQMDPKNEEARLLRGTAYQGLDEFSLAIQDFEAVIRQNSYAAKAYYNLGMIYAFKLGEPGKALQNFDRFLTIDPRHPKAYSVAKTMASLDQGAESDEAELQNELGPIAEIPDHQARRNKLLALVPKYPQSPIPYFLIGKSYEHVGEDDEAIRAYQLALGIRPTCAPCHEALGKLLILRKKTAEGETHLKKAQLFSADSSPSVGTVSEETDSN